MSLFRTAAFMTVGMMKFTKNAFLARQKEFLAHALEVELKGQNHIVTGANSGLGKETTRELLRRGATVHMVCRSKERAEKAREELVEDTGNEAAIVHIVDLSDVRQVKAFARSWVASGSPVHTLVNNAGYLATKHEKTSDGFEASFATNTLGTFVLTEELLPTLKNTAGSRVVVVSSGGALLQGLNVDDPQLAKEKFDGTRSYSQHKRQQICLTELWASRHKTVMFQSMHPGWSDTPGVRTAISDFHAKLEDKFRTSAQGADTIVWLAVAKEAEKFPGGSYFLDRVPQSKHLPMCWTGYEDKDVEKLHHVLGDMVNELEPSNEQLEEFSYRLTFA